ncbi:hypothetical protein K1T71_006981 [Dendrolimus kikuchii]|uniref:Uncharacterized protein n=1 Tax=Dendrolimus kikuchii TaxID=765133 RepID=A0ACC1CZF0_9NEOP|nr:hypothetical protein K1T71_006981 [Dendrolimus kikuchii]
MAIEHSGIAITADVIKTKLIDLAEGGTESGSAFFNRGQQWNKSYDKVGSKLKNGGQLDSNVKNKNVNVKIRCYKCKQIGHYKNKCPKLKSNESDKISAFSAVFLQGNHCKTDWYLDSGASVHMTRDIDLIREKKQKSVKQITTANKSVMPVLCSGNVNIITITPKSRHEVTINNVLCVPDLCTNLISISQLIKNGNKIQFKEDCCCIYNKKNKLQAGIVHQKTNTYTPEQNGMCERINRTIVERARCLLFDAGLDKKFWAEATHTAVYLRNRSIAAGLNNKTPYELWMNKKPDLSHIWIFGSQVMVHIPKEKRLKWDMKAIKGILVGYADNIKGYRIYDLQKKCIIISRDVVVHENIEKGKTSDILVSVGEILPQEEKQKSCDEVQESDSSDSEYVPSSYNSISSDSEKEITNIDGDSLLKETSKEDEHHNLKRKRKEPKRYGNFTSVESVTKDPSSVQEAMKSPDKDKMD